MRVLYTILFTLALPFIVLRLFLRSIREPGYRQHVAERFGLCKKRTNSNKCIWLHAVSVGEQVAAQPLIKLIRQNNPSYDIQITVTTAAGRTRAEALYPDLNISYLPLDIPLFWNIFLKRIRPSACLLMEAELWPNLFFACNKNNIQTILINSRLSKRSAQRYLHIKTMLRQMFQHTTVAAQTTADKDNLTDIGLTAEKITVLGNLKESIGPDQMQISAGITLRTQLKLDDKFIWLAASTHPSEEEIMLEAHKLLLKKIPQAKLILAPRHLKRLSDISKLLDNSTMSWQNKADYTNADIMLWDTMGELMTAYAVADAACVCGSFAPLGGHNILEPAAASKAIIVGPLHHKIKQHCDLLQQNDALNIANDAKELAETLCELHAGEKYLQQGARAKQAASTMFGTAQNYYDWIASQL